MRVISIFLAGVFALAANAQSNTPAPSSTSVDPATAAQNSQQAEIIKCINACTPGDVNCTSKCIAVPNPNEEAIDRTNKCVTACPKGNGTETDNLNYANCLDGCIGKHYFTATGGPAQATSGASGPGASGPGTAGTTSGPSGTTNSEASSRTNSATTTSSSAAGEVMQVSGAAVGLMGFLAAVLAL